jgi:hypothetical protein
MPVSSENHRSSSLSELLHILVENRHYLVAFRDRERSSWTEILLDIDNNQNRMLVDEDLQLLSQIRDVLAGN